MKKIFAFVFSFVLAFSCLPSAFAAETTNDMEITSESLIVVDYGSRIMEKSESIVALMESEDLSYNQAVLEYNELIARSQRLEERYITYDAGMGYLIEVGCQVKVSCGSGHCNFEEVIKEWSEASGSGAYTWNAYYVTVTIEGGTKKDTLRFQTRGTLEVAVDASATGGFEGAGFSLSGTIGGTYYYRKVISIDQTKMMGG